MATTGDPNLTRQHAEIDLLVSMYPTECTRDTSDDSGEVRCRLQLKPSYALEISLPAQYPESAAPVTYLHCEDAVSTAKRKTARAKLAEITEHSWRKQQAECLDMLLEAFFEWLEQFDLSSSAQVAIEDINSEDLNNAKLSEAVSHKKRAHSSAAVNPRLKRTLLWSHHLLAASKRKDIITWSRELHLGGYSRPGYPGAIFVEGSSDSVDEFIGRIKGLRWQALQVRAEQRAEDRVCGNGDDGVFEVEGLGEVVERLRRQDENVAEMFLEGMKIGH